MKFSSCILSVYFGTSERPDSLIDEQFMSDSITTYGAEVVIPLWTLCWVEVLSFFLSAVFSQPYFDLTLSHQDYVRMLGLSWLGFFRIPLWVNIAGSLQKMKLVPAAVSFLSSVLLRCHLVAPRPYSTLKCRGFFLPRSGSACDLPALGDNTACKAVEEIPAPMETVRAIAALPPHCILHPFPWCARLGEGLREVGWGVLLIGLGVFCLGVVLVLPAEAILALWPSFLQYFPHPHPQCVNVVPKRDHKYCVSVTSS